MAKQRGGWAPALIAAAVGLPLFAVVTIMTDDSPSAVETPRQRMLRGTAEAAFEPTHQWVDPRRDECGALAEKCSVLEVVAPRGCPRGLYVAVSVRDDDGTNIGWTNDTARDVRPGEKVRLVFDIYEGNAETISVADVSCR